MRTAAFIPLFTVALAGPALAAPVLMSADWAKEACEAWNRIRCSPTSSSRAAG